MRSLILVLALAAPCSAFAAPAMDYSIPTPNTVHLRAEKAKYVKLTFTSATGQRRQVQIGDLAFEVAPGTSAFVSARVGSTVHVSSDQNSRIAGLIQVSAGDEGRRIVLQ